MEPGVFCTEFIYCYSESCVVMCNIVLMFDLMYCEINVLATNLLFKYSELLWLLKKGQILVYNTETVI